MTTMTARHALTSRNLLLTGWPWRAVAYLLSGVLIGATTLLVLVTLLAVGVATLFVVIGVPVLSAAALSGVPVAAIERRRLRLVDPAVVDDPHQPPGAVGIRAWLTKRYTESATWRELAYTVILGIVLWPVDLAVVGCVLAVPASLVATPALQAVADKHEVKLLKLTLVTSPAGAWTAAAIGLVTLVVGVYVVTGYTTARAAVTRYFLNPRDHELSLRMEELTRSRVRLVDAFDAQRRRIERDLHDGAQQRLVALGMTLGLARLADPLEVPEMLDRAHTQARLALEEIQDLVRGIYPPVLTDRGLSAACAELADRSTIPVTVDMALPRRPAVAIETTAYFVVCEALANVAKHSGASQASVSAHLIDDTLVVEIHDDGVGGADLDRGSGLTGLADRVSVAAGRLSLASPTGGPTLLRVELPCDQINRFG